MRFSLLLSQLFAATTTLFVSTLAQTSTTCNPLHQSCSPDLALSKSISIDFTKGPSSEFTAVGNPTYDSNGVSFSVRKSGDSPTITSKWYIMFGHVDVVLKAAPGVGIVSTLVMLSDDLDEVDYEWLGADDSHVQSNYFVKGSTATYDRGAVHANSGSQDGFQTYSFDWTADRIVWSINGQPVRTLSAATASEGFPQTPMQIKVGVWSAGDPSNAPGTIAWAGGNTNYGAGPYTCQVKSMTVTDYSTGSHYSYGDQSGTWQSIKSDTGSINPNGNGGSSGGSGSQSAPAAQTTVNSSPPFDGTHKDTSSTYTPTGYPWTPTTLATGTVSTTIPGLPSGWTVSASGTVVAPSAAPSTSLPSSSTPSSAASPAITPSAPAIKQGSNVSASSTLAIFTANGASGTYHLMKGLCLVCAVFGGALLF